MAEILARLTSPEGSRIVGTLLAMMHVVKYVHRRQAWDAAFAVFWILVVIGAYFEMLQVTLVALLG